MENKELEKKKNLIDKVKESCYTITFANRYREYFDTFGYVYLPKVKPIQIEGVNENIALWSIMCSSIYNRDKKFYFYTDTNGDLLFDNSFFDYATPFSNGCAFVQFKGWEDWQPVKKSLILDVKRHQKISVPINFEAVDRIANDNITVLDKEAKKWGTYIINPDTGEWNCDIPFIWDGLSFYDSAQRVWVGMAKTFSSYPNWDNTPYYHMIPDWDEVHCYNQYSITCMAKEDAYTLDRFKESSNYGQCTLKNDFWAYVQNQSAFGDTSFDLMDSRKIVDVGDVKKYTYKQSYLKK